jgi:hypothetical protein
LLLPTIIYKFTIQHKTKTYYFLPFEAKKRVREREGESEGRIVRDLAFNGGRGGDKYRL